MNFLFPKQGRVSDLLATSGSHSLIINLGQVSPGDVSQSKAFDGLLLRATHWPAPGPGAAGRAAAVGAGPGGHDVGRPLQSADQEESGHGLVAPDLLLDPSPVLLPSPECTSSRLPQRFFQRCSLWGTPHPSPPQRPLLVGPNSNDPFTEGHRSPLSAGLLPWTRTPHRLPSTLSADPELLQPPRSGAVWVQLVPNSSPQRRADTDTDTAGLWALPPPEAPARPARGPGWGWKRSEGGGGGHSGQRARETQSGRWACDLNRHQQGPAVMGTGRRRVALVVVRGRALEPGRQV